MTLLSRSHAVLGLRNLSMARATEETMYSKSKLSSWESDNGNGDAVWNMLDNGAVVVDVADNDAMSDAMSNTDVIVMESQSIYMRIKEDWYLLETVRLEMKGWRLPMTRLCPIGPIDAIARIIDVASTMFGCYWVGCEWGQIVNCAEIVRTNSFHGRNISDRGYGSVNQK